MKMNKNTILLTSIIALCTVLFVPTASVFADDPCENVNPIITALTSTETTVDVTWIEAIGCDANGTEYSPDKTDIYLLLDGGLAGSTLGIHGDGDVTFGGLAPDTTYDILIGASFNEGLTLITEDSIITQSAPIDCEEVYSLITLSATDTTINVAWTEAMDCVNGELTSPDRYNVFLEDDGYVIDTRGEITDDRDVTFEELDPDTTYDIIVYAIFDGEGEDDGSVLNTKGTITTQTAPIECDRANPIITNLSATQTTVNVEWDEANECDEYGNEISPDSTSISIKLEDGTLIDSDEEINGDVTFSELSPATEYFITIDAIYNGGDLVVTSEEGSIYTEAAPIDCEDEYAEITDTLVTQTTARIIWNEAIACDAYGAEYSPDSTTIYIELDGDEIVTVEYLNGDGDVTFEELDPGTTYDITIEAIFDGGSKTLITEGEIITQSAPKECDEAYSIITDKSSTDTTVSVAWIEAVGCDTENNEVSPDSTFIFIELEEGSGDYAGFVDNIIGNGDVTFEGLAPDTTYEITIQAEFGESTIVTEDSITTEAALIECEDVYPEIINRAPTDTTARIIWIEAVGCDEYGNEISPDSTSITLESEGGYSETVDNVVGDGDVTFDGLTPDTEYVILIEATFSYGDETFTLTTDDTIETLDGCIDVYPAIYALEPTDTTVRIAWSESTTCDEDGREVVPDTTIVTIEQNGQYIISKGGFDGDDEVTFGGLQPDTTYDITIEAVFSYGGAATFVTTGEFTTLVSSDGGCVEVHPVITSLTATETTVDVTWSGAVGCDEYGNEISPDSTSITVGEEGETPVYDDFDIYETGNMSLPGFAPNTTYDITIEAFFGDSSLSTTDTITTLVEGEVVEDLIEEVIEEKSNAGGNEYNTRPTFGIDHETFIQLVDGGFTFNDNSFDVIHNFWTPFPIQTIKIGEVNTFSAKVYADKGLNVQEFLFGIPVVGEAHKAELGIEVFYDNLGEITSINVVQKSDVIDTSTLVVTNDQVKCTILDIQSRCQVTYLEMVFLEPLFDDVMAIKATDFKARSHITYLNDGFDISGKSLNPMITRDIPGPEKYEGPIEVAQTAKYSNIWESNDGRLFESNEYESFEWINETFERTPDDGTMRDRLHSGFAALKQSQVDDAIEKLLSICPQCLESFADFDDPFSYAIPEPIDRVNNSVVQGKMSIESEKAQKIMYAILNPIQQHR